MDTAQTDMTPEHQAMMAGLLPGIVLLRGVRSPLAVAVRPRLALRLG